MSRPVTGIAKIQMPLVGVSMRQLAQAATGDVHDALSQDWGRFLAIAGICWVPLPNRGEEALTLAQAVGLEGIILSGGGDVGKEPARDTTERVLLEYARARALPVLGVCRGFQALQWHLGGELAPVHGHVATVHRVQPAAAAAPSLWGRTVNSFHQLGIRHVAPGLRALALSDESTMDSGKGPERVCERVCADNKHGGASRQAQLTEQAQLVEAACGAGMLGLMWHPERSCIPDMKDLAVVQRFFRDGRWEHTWE